MSRPYATDEQYERWYIAECCRCGRRKNKAGSWPDGHVCRTCADRAVRTRGTCPGCGQERALPGRRPGDGAAICTDCAGFSQSFACARCGFEGKLHGGRLCTRCALADRLADLLDDGSGRIRPELVPLADSLLAMDNPLSGLTWLYSRKGRAGSAGRPAAAPRPRGDRADPRGIPWPPALAGRRPPAGAPDGLRRAPRRRQAGLPARAVAARPPRQHHRRRPRPAHPPLRHLGSPAAAPRPRGEEAGHHGRAAATPATRSSAPPPSSSGSPGEALPWPAAARPTSTPGTPRAASTPATSSGPSCSGAWPTKLTGRFRLPPAVIRHAAPLPDHERISQLGRVLTARDLPLRARVAAAIVLLYAQPLSRIVRLTLDDVIRDGDQVFLRLGEPPSPVPGPVADLLLSWIGSRDNMNTATNRNSPWLFPGRRAGQPMNPDDLAALVNDIGIPTTAGRTSAIRQHVLEMPAPVVADALSYHPVTTARLAAQAGGTFSRYAPGDHERPPSAGEGDS